MTNKRKFQFFCEWDEKLIDGTIWTYKRVRSTQVRLSLSRSFRGNWVIDWNYCARAILHAMVIRQHCHLPFLDVTVFFSLNVQNEMKDRISDDPPLSEHLLPDGSGGVSMATWWIRYWAKLGSHFSQISALPVTWLNVMFPSNSMK